MLLLARRSAVDVRRVALVQLRSVIVTAPEQLREELWHLPLTQLIRRCSRFRRSHSRSADEFGIVLALRSLARRIEAATAEADELEREILGHVRALAPGLLDEPGVGPIVDAQLIVSWSHHDRVRSEAAFARLAGVAPLPASSGQTIRHDSAAVAIANSTAPCTLLSFTVVSTTPRLEATSRAVSRKARPPAKQSASSSANSHASSSTHSKRAPP